MSDFEILLQSLQKTNSPTNKPLWYRKISYQLSLCYNFIYHLIFRQWFQQIDSNIYLGCLPITRYEKEILAIPIHAVVSIVEDFEMEPSLFFTPISKDMWKKHAIEQTHIEHPDFIPVSLEALYQGAKAINFYVEANKICYIHCKAGKGRSAAILMTYYCLFCGMSPEDAFLKIKSKRPIIALKTKLPNILKLIDLYKNNSKK